MNQKDRQLYIERYSQRLSEHGYSPKSLGWGKSGRQEVRFSVLAEPALRCSESSVLDVGCGFADLYEFMINRGWNGYYQGIDIVPGLLEIARSRHPHLDLRLLDIADYEASAPADGFDYVIASGIFNAALSEQNNLDHIEDTITRMFQLAKKAVCIDFMSSNVDYVNPQSWHTDPRWALSLAAKLSRRFLIRHDYMPFEFSLFIFCNDNFSSRNVFASYEQET
ncbi:class I SAM-dependent methyltransferase [bacterium]|nr:class I SAM-dependent methyltransferase [bacterium]